MTAAVNILIAEPVITKTTASLKKVDDNHEKKIMKQGDERPILKESVTDFEVGTITNTPLVILEDIRTFQEIERIDSKNRRIQKVTNIVEKSIDTSAKYEVQEKSRKKRKEKRHELYQVTVEDVVTEQNDNLMHAVEEVISLLNVGEFGLGEKPLRELATIGFLVRQGVSEDEINESLYGTDRFPALRTPDAQNALVQLVERKGHGSLITQVLTEETTTDESVVAATVGFRAFMRMVELQHATVEELIIHFSPEDFRPRAWEVAEITEVCFRLAPIMC